MNDDELEQAMRAGLERRALRVDVDVAVADRARRAARGRRTTRLAMVGAAAAAVVATGVVAVALPSDDGSAPAPGPTDPAGALPTEWRTEYWHDLQVDVPADWGYGAAPVERGGMTLTCFPEAGVTASGRPLRGGSHLPYVGRPVAFTDVCAPYPNFPDEPAVDYVWLGGAVEPGVVELDNGLVQETVQVNGSTLTVATTDPALRRRILASARGGELCSSALDGPPLPSGPSTVDGPARALTVCAYRREGGRIVLQYADDLGPVRARAFARAAENGEDFAVDCDIDPEGYEWVVLRSDGVDTVVDLSCPLVFLPGGRTVRLTDDLTEPWMRGGLPVTMYRFIGPQG